MSVNIYLDGAHERRRDRALIVDTAHRRRNIDTVEIDESENKTNNIGDALELELDRLRFVRAGGGVGARHEQPTATERRRDQRAA